MQDKPTLIIVGGGLVGNSLALALRQLPWRIIQFDTPNHSAAQQNIEIDMRRFALARRSVHFLQHLGVWEYLEHCATAITQVHVSSQGDFGSIRLSAVECGVLALGYTVPAHALVDALEQKINDCHELLRFNSAHVTAIEQQSTQVRVVAQVDGVEKTYTAALVVGADGTNSFVRKACDIPVIKKHYAQSALVFGAQCKTKQAYRAYERFLPDGSIAILPTESDYVGVVWIVPHEQVNELMALPDRIFMSRAHHALGNRLGAWLKVGKRQVWPLQLLKAQHLVHDRVVLIGNAAQTIHPIGAQGFNLGLRDVMALSQQLVTMTEHNVSECLSAYAQCRKPDRTQTIQWSDQLIEHFSRRDCVSRFGRMIAFGALQNMNYIKESLAYNFMGYR